MDVPRQSPYLIKTPPPSRVRFGSFELDLNSGELFSGGGKILLQEQPLQILRMLIEANGEVISRDAIRGRLWPEDTVVEFDHSINAAIKNLRRALDDSAQEPRYIETIARRGYRFIHPVELIEKQPPESTTPSIHPNTVDRRRLWVALSAAQQPASAGNGYGSRHLQRRSR